MRGNLLAAVAAIAVLLPASDALAGVGSGFFGVTPTLETTNNDLAQMGRARVGVLRQAFGWGDLEPSPGSYTLGELDRIVAGAASQGVTVQPFVYGTPPWARNCANVPAFYCDRVTPLRSPEGRQRWPALLRTLVDRYGPRGSLWTDPNDAYAPPYLPIRTWQIWNEANSPTYFRPKPRPKPYYKLLKLSAKAIHSRDPQARIMLAGLFGTPPKPGMTLWKFLDRLYRFKKAKKLFGAVAVHPYSPNIKGIRYQLRRTREVMAVHGDSKTKVFLTELGWGSENPGSSGNSPLFKGVAGQASMLTKSFKFALKNRRRYRIGGVVWFSWRDLQPSSVGNCILCSSFGLLNADSSTKPSYRAFVGFTGGS